MLRLLKEVRQLLGERKQDRHTTKGHDQLDWSISRVVREGSHTQHGTETTGAGGLSDPQGRHNYVKSFKKGR